jgi:hypothetical protein
LKWLEIMHPSAWRKPFLVAAHSGVARWYIFKPKIQILVNFRGSCNGRCWYIIFPFGRLHCQ